MFLDEPTGGVDPVSRRQFWRLIEDLSRSGVTILVTTHYLDEAEHCHRIAIINAGKLAAIGTSRELKQIFADRPIVEIHSSRPVDVMKALDEMDEIQKTTLFGTAVHAVLKPGRDRRGRRSRERLEAQGLEIRRRSIASCRRSRTCSSTSSERRVMMRKALAVGRKEFRQIARDRRSLLILLFVPAFFLLLYGYALNFDVQHIRLAVEDDDRTPASRAAGLGVRELRLLRSGGRRHAASASTSG